jgi:membrane protease YdiL (CAAX protease family)
VQPANAFAVAPLVFLIGYLAAVLLIGGLLAYPVYLAVQPLYGGPFASVVQRVVALAALALLPVYLMRTHATDRHVLGFAGSRAGFVRSFMRWFLIGIILALPLQIAFLALDIRALVPLAGRHAGDVLLFLSTALLTSILLGLLEESYFRGALLGSLGTLPRWLAVGVVSVVYAAAHFLAGPVPAAERDWSSGLVSIQRSVFALDAFLALLAAGLLFGAMRLRFGSIAPGAGIHAGAVLCIKLAQEYSDLNPDSELQFLAGSLGGSMGWLGLLWMAILGAAWIAVARLRPSPAPE